MKYRTKKQAAISLVAVLLTVLASGDDFNVAGLAWSYTLDHVPSGPSPLDDDNLDFVKSAESQELLSKAPVVSTIHGPQLIPPGLLFPIERVPFRFHPFLLDNFFFPLRC